MIKTVVDNDNVIAIIGRDNYLPSSNEFLTDEQDLLQLGFISYPENHSIKPHKHINFERSTMGTNEFLILKKGKVRLNLYDDKKNLLETYILNKGDWVLLLGGSHGFEIIETCVMLEVKNGPYAGDKDKVRFDASE